MNPFSLIPAPYQILAKIIGVAILCIALLYAWHRFTEHFREQGREEIRLELQPQIDNLKINNKTLTDAYADLASKAKACDDSVKNIASESEKKKAASTAALADAEKRATDAIRQSRWLSEQLNKPNIDKESCANVLKAWRAQP